MSEQLLSLILRSLPIVHGKHRLLDKMAPRAWKHDERMVRVHLGKNVFFFVEVDDLVGWHFAVLRSFDPEVASVLISSSSAQNGDVFWDIGANKGACFAAIAKHVPDAKIVAIEPQAALADLNIVNLESACKGRFEYYQVAIGTECSTMTLTIPSGNKGKASLQRSGSRDGDLTESIAVVTASSIAERSKFGWPTLVKIDVEGHEHAVLESLTPAFQNRSIRALVFENHFGEIASFDMARSIANLHGYHLYGISKSLFSTRLNETSIQMHSATDYLLLRDDLRGVADRFQ